jgi:hypothetical protein
MQYSLLTFLPVIKIFGIYTHAQIDRRLWDSMGRQLGRKGKEYRDRCTIRNRPHHAGDNVILPACFPPPEKTTDVASVVPELPKEDLEEVSRMLVIYTAANLLVDTFASRVSYRSAGSLWFADFLPGLRNLSLYLRSVSCCPK